ncbi:unnamed protein product [Brachionus calyciflorus]|uniref:PAN-3 domain-containing protein n=1 Tax=Brachionus calyciflorus TaxID=104777 RepID=A0A814ARX3_9BILA|nr:unnamed protein product [Brachionus calyciflorus]
MKKSIVFVVLLTLPNFWNGISGMSYTKMFGFYEISPTQIGSYVSAQSTILLGSINGKSKLECFKTCSLNSDCLLIQFDNSENCELYNSIQSLYQSDSYIYFIRKIQNKGIILDYNSQVIQVSKLSTWIEFWFFKKLNNIFHIQPFTFRDHLNFIEIDL